MSILDCEVQEAWEHLIRGRYFNGRDSRTLEVQLEIGADRMVRIHGLAEPYTAPLDAVAVSDRVGRIPRRLTFADQSVFETDDNDAVDAALAALTRDGFQRCIARWESRWVFAIVALLAVAAGSWLFIRHGVPWAASQAAGALPSSVDRAVGAQGLELLDKAFLGPSRLPGARQQALRDRFEQMTRTLADGHEYRLELRRGRSLGANALALPSGIVVMTDELVRLAKDDDELVAVLAHEIGHVGGRHALRMLLQNAGVAALALAVLGDVSSASALAAAIPTALLQAKHSRDFEREADAYSRQWLRENDVDPARFDAILCRLASAARARQGSGGGGDPGGALSYWSSHPPAGERAACPSAS
jgi:Zn-dependent protease with chaperone function